MEDDLRESIAGAITAQNFILQNVYALILAQDPDPVRACQRTAKELMRQFEDLPATNAKPLVSDEAFRITQHGVHHLERFWANVEFRLQKHADRTG